MTGGDRVSIHYVCRSEWTKLRSLRSTWALLALSLTAMVGLGVLLSALRAAQFTGNDIHAAPGNPGPVFHGGLDPVAISLRGVLLAQLAIGTLGVLAITGEYASGTIRASLAAVPRRLVFLFGKVAVLGVLTIIFGTVASLIAFLGGQAMFHAHHLGLSLSSPEAARAVIGGGLLLTIVALLAMGIGLAVRSTAMAMAALFGLIFVVPLVTAALPSAWQSHMNPYLPLNAGMSLITSLHQSSGLSPWMGEGVFAAYAVAGLAIGTAVLMCRDA